MAIKHEYDDCDICGQSHPVGYDGDCRNNTKRRRD
jgi:hypothetical protein